MAATRAAALLDAYVLHRYDWSESSLILDVFTRARGRLALAAKGAKRPYSQLRAVLLPFQRVQITLARGAGSDEAAEVHTLRSAEWASHVEAGNAAMLTGAALFSGFYLNELLMKLLARHDPHPALFDAYAQSLQSLAGPDDLAAEAALRAFELTLLKETGVLPELDHVTATQQAVHPRHGYVLLPEVGIAAPRGAGDVELSGAALARLQAALDGGGLAALQAACVGLLPALKAQLRTLLQYHLGHATLRTRQVMTDLQGL